MGFYKCSFLKDGNDFKYPIDVDKMISPFYDFENFIVYFEATTELSDEGGQIITAEEYNIFKSEDEERRKKPLEVQKEEKMTDIYNRYQKEKSGLVTSSLTGSDGLTIVFEYGDKNRDDYRSIIASFAVDPNQTESIIGSYSHGKFFITRDQIITLKDDFLNHETKLYLKIKDREKQVEQATEDILDNIVW